AANGGKRRRSGGGGAEEKSGSTSNTTEEHAPDSSAPSDGPSADGKSPPGAVMPGGDASAGGSGAAMEEEPSAAGHAADAGNNDTPPGHGSGKDPNEGQSATAAVAGEGQDAVPMETESAQSNDTKVDDTAKKKTTGYPSQEAASAGNAASDAPTAEDAMDTSENDAGPPAGGGVNGPRVRARLRDGGPRRRDGPRESPGGRPSRRSPAGRVRVGGGGWRGRGPTCPRSA
ncbi:hypothetical protein THAOC_06506, partial [Thalassiosira oceanica]